MKERIGMHIGHGLTIGYESSPEDIDRVTEALDRQWRRAFKGVVLHMNQIGLLARMRFGRSKA